MAIGWYRSATSHKGVRLPLHWSHLEIRHLHPPAEKHLDLRRVCLPAMSNLKSRSHATQHGEGNAVSPDAEVAQWAKVDGENARKNADIPVSFQFNQPSDAASMFKIATIAPSPPPGVQSSSAESSTLSHLDTSTRRQSSRETPDRPSPLSAGLRIHTDIIPGYNVTAPSAINTGRASGEFSRTTPRTPKSLGVQRTPSIKNILSTSIGSSASAPGSVVSSPMLNAMADVTPLPSPLMSGDSPGPWKKLISRPTSRDLSIPMTTADSVLVTANGESISSAIANLTKRRTYHVLGNDSSLASTGLNKEKNSEGHRRNRSISDYIPDPVQIPKLRNITVSGSHNPILDATPDSATSTDSYMRREPHLALQRGLAPIPRYVSPNGGIGMLARYENGSCEEYRNGKPCISWICDT